MKKGIPKFAIYGLLILCTTIPLFFKIPLPNKPSDASLDFYQTVSALKEGDVVLLGSDWTGSTRGESKGHMKAVLRMLMRKKVKFVIWSTADPQAPRAALDVIAEVNMERKERYQRWEQWVSAGYYPNSDVAINAVAQDIRTAFGARRENDLNGNPKPIFDSPVMQKIKTVSDFDLVIDVTASKTTDFHVQYISAKGVPMAFAVTGVMSPEIQVFYNSKQIKGFIGGLKGVFDMEQMMEHGVNNPGKDGAAPVVKVDSISGSIPGFPGEDNIGQGTKYYPALHVALVLMIALIVKGNLEMLQAKKRQGGKI